MRILNLGAGVQSSTLYLMACAGEIQINRAIFADTHGEPRAVYQYLDYLKSQAGPPIDVVSAGELWASVLENKTRRTGHTGQPPFYVKNEGTEDKGGMLWRKCTQDFKIAPINQHLRALLGVPKGQRVPAGVVVEQLYGISLDELTRMRTSKIPWLRNIYPLIERRMTRQDCVAWLAKHGHPDAPKSACVFCPYRSNAHWRQMRREQPLDFAQAVQCDVSLRQGGRIAHTTGTLYIHRSFQPLSHAVLEPEEGSQLDMFLDECGGYCGV